MLVVFCSIPVVVTHALLKRVRETTLISLEHPGLTDYRLKPVETNEAYNLVVMCYRRLPSILLAVIVTAVSASCHAQTPPAQDHTASGSSTGGSQVLITFAPNTS